MESDFQISPIPDPRKSVFGPVDVFAVFFGPNITDVFTVWKMFHKLVLILCISFSYEPDGHYCISPFIKTILNIEICVKGVSGKSGFF